MTNSERFTGWRKSSYCGPSNGECLEVADVHRLSEWRKSSYSGGSNGSCLEVVDGHPVVPVRDSKLTQGPVLVFPVAGWSSFVSAVNSGTLGRQRRSA